MRKSVLSFVLAALAYTGVASAQEANAPTPAPVKLMAAIDTLGIVTVQPGVYATWIFAMASPRSWPSSAIFVLFDCKARKVARVRHIVYKMRPDSLGVAGPVVEDSGEWVDVHVPKTFDLVCSVGAAHEAREQANEEYDRKHDAQPVPDMHPDWRQS
jgi:hypothetical protein